MGAQPNCLSTLPVERARSFLSLRNVFLFGLYEVKRITSQICMR
ncbi:hypothetical protein NT03LS_2692, partial [Listeria seeligeri FSL N1-067]